MRTQADDNCMQSIQQLLVKATSNVVKLVDKNGDKLDSEDMNLVSNAIALLGHTNKLINTRRKELHKSDLDPKYHHLASSSLPFTDLLYGNDTDVNKNVKEINDLNKIGRNLGRGYGRGAYRGGFRSRRPHPYRRGGFRGRGFQNRAETAGGAAVAKKRQDGAQEISQVSGFEAGRLRHYIENWRKITSDETVLDIVEHCHIKFLENVNPIRNYSFSSRFTPEEDLIVDREIQKLIEMKVLKEVEHHPEEFLSPIFIVPKKNGEYRIILNLKGLNEYIEYHHFKMDTLESVLKLVKPGCYFASVDLRHAYYSVSLAPEHRIKLRFEKSGKIYQYEVLPNGIFLCA